MRVTEERPLEDLRTDLRRYGVRPWLREQSVWAVAVYRLGRWSAIGGGGPLRAICRRAYWPVYRAVETLTGISLGRDVMVGPGLRIWHFGGIVVHDGVRIGSNCTLRHGTTIGSREDDGPLPVIGDDVELGAGCQVLGGVTIGDGARIGAMTLVLEDVPPGATAVGVPARLIAQPSVH